MTSVLEGFSRQCLASSERFGFGLRGFVDAEACTAGFAGACASGFAASGCGAAGLGACAHAVPAIARPMITIVLFMAASS
jgi:hypothetical protein